MTITKKDGARVLALRWRRGLTQKAFWTRLGVSQSGGSRYESGRRIPQSLLMLIEFAYGNKALQLLKRLRGWR